MAHHPGIGSGGGGGGGGTGEGVAGGGAKQEAELPRGGWNIIHLFWLVLILIKC